MAHKKEKIIIYQKPTCSTCRAALRELREAGADFESVNYYEKPFTKEGLKDILEKLHMRPRELLRTKEEIHKKLHLAEKKYSDDEIIDLMLQHPDLIQRPIVVRGERAVLARPIDKIKKII